MIVYVGTTTVELPRIKDRDRATSETAVEIPDGATVHNVTFIDPFLIVGYSRPGDPA